MKAIPLLVPTCLFLMDAVPSALARTAATPCPPGRYLVETPPLLGQGGDAGSVVTVTAGGEVDVAGLCPPAPAARLKARRKGTKVKGAWDACGDLERVRLKLRIAAPGCTDARGVLKGKRTKRSRFRATRLAACTETNPTESEIESAVEDAFVGLADPWGDPDDFRTMLTRVEVRLGCSFGWLESRGDPAARAAAMKPPYFQSYDPNTTYCGKGTSQDDIDLTMRGSDCLNETCFVHDVCYYEDCVLGRCSWSTQSDECDRRMFDMCNELPVNGGCRGGDGWSEADVAICTIAKIADAAQDTFPQDDCQEPACGEGESCNPESGMCETTTTTTTTVTSTTETTATTPTTTTTITTPTTVTSTTIPPIGGIQVVPPFACIPTGGTQQLEAFVEGVSNPTITWTRAVGYGQVNANGLYTAPPIGTTDDVIKAEAAEVPGTYGWANIHAGLCNCQWGASVTGATTWNGGGWYNTYFVGPGVINFVFDQDDGPAGEERGGNIAGGVIGDIPLPGSTGIYTAEIAFFAPDGRAWLATGDETDVPSPMRLFVAEMTDDTIRAEFGGSAARRNEQGDVIDIVTVVLIFEGTRFGGAVSCE